MGGLSSGDVDAARSITNSIHDHYPRKTYETNVRGYKGKELLE